jgi:hypothetical protein
MGEWMYRSTFSWPRREWSASRPCHFTPGKEPRYLFYRRLGGPQSRSGRNGEMKIFCPTGTRTPASFLIVQPVASRYTEWAIPAPPCIRGKYVVILFTSIPTTYGVRIWWPGLSPAYVKSEIVAMLWWRMLTAQNETTDWQMDVVMATTNISLSTSVRVAAWTNGFFSPVCLGGRVSAS